MGVLERGDLQRAYIINAWNRLLENYKEEIISTQKDSIFQSIKIISLDTLQQAQNIYLKNLLSEKEILDQKNFKDDKQDNQDQPQQEQQGEDDQFLLNSEDENALDAAIEVVKLITKMTELFPGQMSEWIESFINKCLPIIDIKPLDD